MASPSATCLTTVALVVPDYDPAIAFFVTGLGFTLCEDIDQGSKRWVTVAPPGGGARLLLARAEGAAQRAAIGNQAGGRVFLFPPMPLPPGPGRPDPASPGKPC